MANKSVVLYQYCKVRNTWKYVPAIEPLKQLSKGSYCLSWYEGKEKQFKSIGPDPEEALHALEKKRLELAFVAAGGEIKDSQRERLIRPEENKVQVTPVRRKLSDAVTKYLGRRRTRQGKSGNGMAVRSVEAYEYRLGFLFEFRPSAYEDEIDRDVYLDEIDKDFLYEFLAFLRKHKNNLGDRTCYNAMQAVGTFLLHHRIGATRSILKEISFPPTEVIPYTNEEMATFFTACSEKEELLFKFFLHSMARDMEVAHCEVRDIKFNENLVHISPKPDKGFRLKGKRSGQATKGCKVPLPVRLVERLRRHFQGRAPRAPIFPCRTGGINTHFLRVCKNIAKRAGVPNWEEFDLHRWRKTGATRYHESGVSVRTIQYRLGHESLEVTLDYLGIQNSSEEGAQDVMNNGVLSTFV